MNKIEYLQQKLFNSVDENLKNSLLLNSLDAWFKQRLSFWVVIVVMIPCYGMVMYLDNQNFSDTQVGFLMITLALISGDFIYVCFCYANLENTLISLESCLYFDKLAPESEY